MTIDATIQDADDGVSVTIQGGGGAEVSNEQIEDVVGALLSTDSNLTSNYDDANNELTLGLAQSISVSSVDSSQINSIQHVMSADDLPDPTNGTHTLADTTIYHFMGTVTSDNAIEVGTTSPILGAHQEHTDFVYTGGTGAAIRGTGEDVLIHGINIQAPGATIIDADGGGEADLIIDLTYFTNDNDNTDPIASLGTISGFETPNLHGVACRDFDAGLTIGGSSNHVTVHDCEFRDVTGTDTTLLNFASDFVSDTVQFDSNHVYGVQSDTSVVDVDANATINEVFFYTGNTHGTDVIQSNIFDGSADLTLPPYWVSDSFPLRNSTVIGEVSLDSPTQTDFTSADTWEEVSGSTTEGNETQRTTSDGAGGIEYIGRKDTNVQITMSVSWSGSNGDEYQFAVGKNGTPEPTSALPVQGGGQNTNLTTSLASIEDLAPNDTISLMVKNVDSTSSCDITRYNINFMGD